MRWHLFPEIRVSQGTFDLGSPSSRKVETVPDIVRVMDLQQEQLARSMGEGHRVIHGVAGSVFDENPVLDLRGIQRYGSLKCGFMHAM